MAFLCPRDRIWEKHIQFKKKCNKSGGQQGLQEEAPVNAEASIWGSIAATQCLGKDSRAQQDSNPGRHRARCLILGATKTPPEQNCSLQRVKHLSYASHTRMGLGLPRYFWMLLQVGGLNVTANASRNSRTSHHWVTLYYSYKKAPYWFLWDYRPSPTLEICPPFPKQGLLDNKCPLICNTQSG